MKKNVMMAETPGSRESQTSKEGVPVSLPDPRLTHDRNDAFQEFRRTPNLPQRGEVVFVRAVEP